ncbi:HlyD family secretion protein [Pseudaminobacter arsenicus]|uniref:HlyD family secretion protein n=1 Tax=Borborobacter arsenicus TaxID=1851146 RepID=A0A432UZZ3_9HYPH|nr:HlyD family secretion protein [Pseudaminobacter arsenicus]RUM95493.1 HlyD family secretion protein [Pseudaminobacter arsenicus]
MNAVSKISEDVTTVEPQQALQAVAEAPPVIRKRRLGRVALMVAVPLALVVGGGYFWVTGGRYQETENANLRQAKVSIASEAAGRIVAVDVADNARVKAGDVLFSVDPEPYRIALAQADAALAAARLNVEQLRAAYSQALAQERVAVSQIDYVKAQFERSTELADRGISAKASLDEARRDLAKAEDEHAAAVQGVASALAALGGDPEIQTDKHPSVLAALATRDKAAYELARTTVHAPADGVVSQASSFKIGQFVGAGTPLFSLVETGDTWVEANFKETQLTHMKPGQEAEITLDTYPGRPLKATVEAIGAGTGAEFSLLPAQNATGNWVKVTQRIPVRLKIDTEALPLALSTGMSATVSVDTGVSRGLSGLLPTAHAAE